MKIHNGKQLFQLMSFTGVAQSHLPLKVPSFLKPINICRGYSDAGYTSCYRGDSRVDYFSREIKELISVHYPSGYKPNKKRLSWEHRELVMKFYERFGSFEFTTAALFDPRAPIDPIDYILLVKTQRACMSFLKNGMTDEQLSLLFKKLDEISIILKQKKSNF
jgi:hypothetical protein